MAAVEKRKLRRYGGALVNLLHGRHIIARALLGGAPQEIAHRRSILGCFLSGYNAGSLPHHTSPGWCGLSQCESFA